MLTESTGQVGIESPQGRDRSFEPQIIRKRQRRLTGVDEMVLSLDAKGLTTSEISAHFAKSYGAVISKEWPVTVSAVNSMNPGFTARAGDCLRSGKVPWVTGRSGSAIVNYVRANTLGWSRVWDGTGPGLWWCDSASMPVVPGSLFSRRCSRLLLAAWVRAVSPVRT